MKSSRLWGNITVVCECLGRELSFSLRSDGVKDLLFAGVVAILPAYKKALEIRKMLS